MLIAGPPWYGECAIAWLGVPRVLQAAVGAAITTRLGAGRRVVY